ncbi:hypothetical protein TanjilG_08199 [Lupinus angustifolius]|uniref:Uncharacterized protein n=2 Tax=Lupinus angustifolius TaxID=3871 RepID=A0A1J7HS38_LUPAN|nr:hypothetical protein TanjilG_08199 [Lupinus angustifolius]
MAKVTFFVVFALVLVVPLGSVLGQGDWSSLLDQASAAGLPEGALDEAKKALNDGSAQMVAEAALSDGAAQKAAEEVLGGSGNADSLSDWVGDAK